MSFGFAHGAIDPEACPWERIEIALAGDLMTHSDQQAAARRRGGDADFSAQFDAIRPWIAGADLALANFETVVGGEPAGYSGFPKFNAPDTVVDAVVGAGFDAVQTANNHCLDREGPGLLRTLSVLDRRGLPHVGTWSSPPVSPVLWLDVRGLTIGLVAGTFSTNNIPLPADAPWAVTTIDQLGQAIRAARPASDLVIAGIHWGWEYELRPRPQQVAQAHAWVDDGADVVWGHHPHVVQPSEAIDWGDRDALVLYSHGNFVSGQRPFPRYGGVITRLELAFCPVTREVRPVDVRFLPTYVDVRDRERHKRFRVVPADWAWYLRDPDLDAADVREAERYRQHLANLLPPERIGVDPPGPGEPREAVPWAADPTAIARLTRFLRGVALDPAFPE